YDSREEETDQICEKLICRLDEFFVYEFLSIYLQEGSSSLMEDSKILVHIDDVLLQFGVNMMIRNNQFVPRQSEKIVTEIYDPTFMLLDDLTYEGVNSELSKAFESFRAKDYEDVITKSINAVQFRLHCRFWWMEKLIRKRISTFF
ncbi:MAG: hypothetical protein ACK5HT_03210, partial [Draconibacterium sp.]